jgi:hypothetical protein
LNKSIVVGAVAVTAVFAGVFYFASDRTVDGAAAVQAPAEENATEAAANGALPGEPLRSPSGLPVDAAARDLAVARQAPPDPRLAALAVSPDNGQIHFVTGPDGKVIQEIDNNPASPTFRKPLREYMYAGERVVGLTKYEYLGNRVQTTRTMVSYKPDGSVDQFRESTD